MLITFKSTAGGDVSMFEKNAREMLSLLGKHPHEPRGVITVEQLPGAIDAVLAAIAADKAQQPNQAGNDGPAEDESEREIHLAQRAQPLLELLQVSLTERSAVTWGV